MATAKKKTTSARQPSPSSPKPKVKESARVREMATKSGSSAMRKSQASYDKISSMVDKSVQRGKSQSGDLGGPNSGQLKGFDYGSPVFQRSRTEQRQMDQTKRKAAPKNSTGKDQPVRAGRKAQGTGGKSYADTAMKRGNTGDLAGRGGPIQKVYKGGDTSISIGIPERGRGRTNQRAIDQFKRKKK